VEVFNALVTGDRESVTDLAVGKPAPSVSAASGCCEADVEDLDAHPRRDAPAGATRRTRTRPCDSKQTHAIVHAYLAHPARAQQLSRRPMSGGGVVFFRHLPTPPEASLTV
jgi:hypothetical protein